MRGRHNCKQCHLVCPNSRAPDFCRGGKHYQGKLRQRGANSIERSSNKAIGLIVARDFGVDGGIYHGKIAAVDCEGRRVHYHVRYDDGDEEDFDYDEMR